MPSFLPITTGSYFFSLPWKKQPVAQNIYFFSFVNTVCSNIPLTHIEESYVLSQLFFFFFLAKIGLAMNSWYAAQCKGIGLNVETGVFLAQPQPQYVIVVSLHQFSFVS